MADTNMFGLVGIGSNVRLGKTGSRLKENTGTLEIRDNADVAYANLRALDMTADGNMVVQGDLTVNGVTTTINTQTLIVEDKNIELGVVGTPTDVTANLGGITLKGTTDKTITWVNATDSWVFNQNLELDATYGFRIGGTLLFNKDGSNNPVLQGGGTSLVLGTGANTVTTLSNANIILDPNGTGLVQVGAAITTDTNTDLFLSPNGTGLVQVGAAITTASNTNLVLSPNGTGVVELAKDLDVKTFSVTTSTANGNILISPNGTGSVVVNGTTPKIKAFAAKGLLLEAGDATNSDGLPINLIATDFNGTGTLGGNVILTVGSGATAADVGTARISTTVTNNQYNTAIDAAGNFAIATRGYVQANSASGIKTVSTAFVFGTTTTIGSALTGRVVRVKVAITSAFTGTTLMTVGRTGAVSELAVDADIDYSTPGLYVIENNITETAQQLNIYVTGGSAGAGYVIVEYI